MTRAMREGNRRGVTDRVRRRTKTLIVSSVCERSCIGSEMLYVQFQDVFVRWRPGGIHVYGEGYLELSCNGLRMGRRVEELSIDLDGDKQYFVITLMTKEDVEQLLALPMNEERGFRCLHEMPDLENLPEKKLKVAESDSRLQNNPTAATAEVVKEGGAQQQEENAATEENPAAAVEGEQGRAQEEEENAVTGPSEPSGEYSEAGAEEVLQVAPPTVPAAPSHPLVPPPPIGLPEEEVEDPYGYVLLTQFWYYHVINAMVAEVEGKSGRSAASEFTEGSSKWMVHVIIEMYVVRLGVRYKRTAKEASDLIKSLNKTKVQYF
uniref:Uncharacterized protein n=1 Tax=Chromera velia CCMP2878 TaxID=1169474 RepID=A0A0G4IAS7_9ALVE|eukprot:Cvel_12675.t1-p1 / transcript=Cvel_12675.t1 / gene=Cvel_12675 / organism=Chromera_velia_CCMP2878 / gene_product=hypothetical protein / transcript_product=hypothetical protein / location=Cvel_scaffold838:20455-23707(+) / protein_length=320 / sequence_SO=supercontig / SO=protein_coding / is_pseudo=false